VNDDILSFRIPDAVKDPDETLKVTIDCYAVCAIPRLPNEVYATNEYVRPVVPNGFAYQAQTGGLSGTREPHWPTTLAATVIDGSVTWTCSAPAANGLNPLTAPTGTSDPAGLTISAVSASESFKILATYAGGTAGQDYDAVFGFTVDGVARIARQRVRIRKR